VSELVGQRGAKVRAPAVCFPPKQQTTSWPEGHAQPAQPSPYHPPPTHPPPPPSPHLRVKATSSTACQAPSSAACPASCST
jgi:hypothetical protein